MKIRPITIAFVLFCFVGCHSDKVEVPASDLPNIDIDIHRLDNRIEEISNKEDLENFAEQHPNFSTLVFQRIIPIMEKNGDLDFEKFKLYQQDSSIQELNVLCEKVFDDPKFIQNSLTNPFQHLKYYFPNYTLPNVYTWNSGFQYLSFLMQDGDRDGICIGLDFFLGEAFPYQSLALGNPSFSEYISRTFNKDHFSKKVMEAIVSDILPYPKQERMLDLMIYNGKKTYILEKLLPTIPDTVLHEYTPAQVEWCADNERNIWNHFLEKKLFYESDTRKINKYVNPSPDSPGMPQEAPGRTGNYIGYKIIQRYMTREQQPSLQKLISLDDPQSILDISKYKPL